MTLELQFGQQRAYEKLEGSGASELFGMYVLAYPGSEVAYAFTDEGEKTQFYDALWKGDIVECLFTTSKREGAQLEDILFGSRPKCKDFFELHTLLPDLEMPQ